MLLKKPGGRLLTDVTVFDVYTGENVGIDKKSIAYSLTFNDVNKTLTEDEINVLLEKIIKDVEEKNHGQLRSV